MIPTTIIRHSKERTSNCSLEPLVGREGIEFLTSSATLSFPADGFILLAVDAPVLSPSDAGHPLLILDSTWNLLPQLERCITGTPIPRSIPRDVETAYPRRSKSHKDDPEGGLASVEALYVAWKMLGVDDISLLQDYYWKEEFLRQFK